jgi:hypothetical protein
VIARDVTANGAPIGGYENSPVTPQRSKQAWYQMPTERSSFLLFIIYVAPLLPPISSYHGTYQ